MKDFKSQYFLEFLSTFKKPYTYIFFHNPYFFFGFFWGLPVPFFVVGTALWALDLPLSVHSAIYFTREHPSFWFYPLHPFLFGILFGALGSIRLAQDIKINQLFSKLKSQATLDPLTGLYNRRFFLDFFDNEVSRTGRDKQPFAVVLFDIDDFKKVNDQYGHLVGDQVLKELATVFQSCCRPYDVISRWGGEEFIILLPKTNAQEADEVAQRILINFSQKIFSDKNREFNCTLSAGVAEFDAARYQNNAEKIIQDADSALYQAKHNGKNQVRRSRS